LKENLTFAEGKERIFGSQDPAKAGPGSRRGGKRIYAGGKPAI